MIQQWPRRVAALIFLCAWSGWAAAGEPSGIRVTAAAELGRTDVLHAVAAHRERVIAVGDAGLVLESGDGGRQWERQELADAPPLIDACACESGRFFLLDFRGGLWRLEGAGADPKWQRQEIPGARSLAITCDPDGRLWAVGEQSSILRSDDAGTTWLYRAPESVDRLLTDVVFLDRERARIVGEFGSYFASDDGGAQWQRGPDIPDELYPHAVHATPGGELVVVGNGGGVYRLQSGTWRAEGTGDDSALYGINGIGESVIAVGERGMAFLQGRDAHWQAHPLLPAGMLPSRYLRGLSALGDGALVAVGERALLRLEVETGGAP